nr:uncharacterized protein LOC129382287 isoform X2 [Dermacentor andersoni]
MVLPSSKGRKGPNAPSVRKERGRHYRHEAALPSVSSHSHRTKAAVAKINWCGTAAGTDSSTDGQQRGSRYMHVLRPRGKSGARDASGPPTCSLIVYSTSSLRAAWWPSVRTIFIPKRFPRPGGRLRNLARCEVYHPKFIHQLCPWTLSPHAAS